MKTKFILAAAALTLVMSSCSPFGGQSVIDVISDIGNQILDGKTNTGVVSGATEELETNPGLPAQNYKASVAVGGQFGQDVTEPVSQNTGLPSGYQVYTTIQGTDNN